MDNNGCINMGKIVYAREREKEIHENNKLDLNLFKKRSSAKTAKGIILGYMKKFSKSEDDVTFNKKELVFVFQELYKKIGKLEKND